MRGHLKLRGSVWYAKVELLKVNGKRRMKWIRLNPEKTRTDRDRQKELTRILHDEVDNNQPHDDERQTVAQFMARWLATRRKDIALTTYATYESRIRLYINPHIGEKPIGKLNGMHLDEFYAKITRTDDKPGLTPQTVRIIHIILHSAFKRAVKWGLLVKNPADAATASRGETKPKRVLDGDQTAELLYALEGTPMHLPGLLLTKTGMRRGEVLALRWQDVDFDAKRIHVRQSVQRTKGKPFAKAPKSQTSRRGIPIHDSLIQELLKHQYEQRKRRFAIGPAWQDRDLILDNGMGDFISPTTFSGQFKLIAARHGFPDVTPHLLRHGHASILNSQGVSPRAISERLGHSSIAITSDLYTHLFTSEQEGAADAIERALTRKKKAKEVR